MNEFSSRTNQRFLNLTFKKLKFFIEQVIFSNKLLKQYVYFLLFFEQTILLNDRSGRKQMKPNKIKFLNDWKKTNDRE